MGRRRTGAADAHGHGQPPARSWWLPVAGGAAAGLVAGLFGVGGGVLLVPILVFALRRAQHIAHATSLVAITVPAAAGAARFAADGEVVWSGAAAVAVGALVGVQAGAWVLPRVPERRLRVAFALLLAALAVRLLVVGEGEPIAGGDGRLDLGAASLALHAVLGLVSGTLSALLGIGGGAVIVPALVVLFGYGQHAAEGTSLAIILPTALLGAATHARHGYTEWRVGGLLGVGGLVGALAGAELALALPGAVLARAFGVLLAVITVAMVRRRGDPAAGPDRGAGRQAPAGTTDVTVRPLTERDQDAFLALFDRPVLPADWDGCYCYYDRFPGAAADFDPRDAERNRSAMCRLLDADLVRGWLGFAGDRPVGWCSAAARVELPHLKVDAPPPPREQRIAAITCIVIDPDWRGQGVARRLVDAAAEAFAHQGFDAVEAYPAKDDGDRERAYRGRWSMYRDAGFVVVGETATNLVVRRPLR